MRTVHLALIDNSEDKAAADAVIKLGKTRFQDTGVHVTYLHGHANIGRPKVASAQDRIADVNPDVKVVVHEEPITSENAMQILGQYDIVVNGSDNFATRYLVNDAAYLLGKPLVEVVATGSSQFGSVGVK